ncbi:hypothetical protein ACGFIJ_17495 [Microbispora bryophytorum]|uniref:hypothetical protein n=1 Tax=Microbispora bryophytorum TaxID=1460882 RepID=UPI00371B77F8
MCAGTPSAGGGELCPEPLAEIDAWLAPYRRLWSDGFDALERHLDTTPDHSEETP